MNVKLFQTRLDSQHIQQDQAILNAFMESVKVKRTSTQFVIGQPDFWSILVFYEEKVQRKNGQKESDKISFEADAELTDEETQIVSALKQWRRDRAKEVNVPEYLICHNASLVSVSKTRPRSIADLTKVKGFGNQKIAKYGDDIIAVVNAF